MIDVKDIARNIKRIRISRGMTQAELGARLFVAPQTVSKWERGLSCPDIIQLGDIADALDTPIRALLEKDAMSEESAFIAIDGGGTKTEFVLFRHSGEILSRVLLSGSNPNICGLTAATDTLIEGIDSLLSGGAVVSTIFAGIAGCGLKNNSQRITAKLKRRYPEVKIAVESDIKNVIGSIENNKNCIAAIIGTGSSVFGWDGATLRQAGGWGYIFDEAGSGYDVGRDVIRRALEYEDGMIPSTPLVERVHEKLGNTVHALIPEIHSKGTRYIASFSSLAFEAARDGDAYAQEIIRRSVDRICDLIIHVAKDSAEGYSLVLAGGLCENMDVIGPMLKAKLGDQPFTVPDLPQIFGAARMCLDLSGEQYDFTTFYKKFNDDYGEIQK